MRHSIVFRACMLALFPCILQEPVLAMSGAPRPLLQSRPLSDFEHQSLATPLLQFRFSPVLIYEMYRFVTRPLRRLKQNPDVRQETLRYSITVLLMWGAFMNSGSWPAAAIVAGVDMVTTAAVRTLRVGAWGRWLDRHSDRLFAISGWTPIGLAGVIGIWGKAPWPLLAIGALGNGFLMGQASLARRRMKKRANPSHMTEDTFASSGARLLGLFLGSLPFWPLTLSTPGVFQFDFNAGLYPRQLAFLFLLFGSLYTSAGHLLLRRRNGATTTAAFTSLSPIALLSQNAPLLKRSFVLLVSSALSPVLLLPGIATILLLRKSPQEAGFWLAAMAILPWAGSRLIARIQEKYSTWRGDPFGWQLGNWGSGFVLLFLSYLPSAGWAPSTRQHVTALCLFLFGLFHRAGHVIVRDTAKDLDDEAALEAYSSVVQLGMALGGLLLVLVMATSTPTSALFHLGSALLVFQLLLVYEPIRHLVFLNKGWITSAFVGYLAGDSGFWWVRGVSAVLYLIYWYCLPWLGHDPKNRTKQDTVYTIPALALNAKDIPQDFARPDDPLSVKPSPWKAEDTLPDGTPVRYYQTLIVTDAHLRSPTILPEVISDLHAHNRIARGAARAPVSPEQDLAYGFGGDMDDQEVPGPMPDSHSAILDLLDARIAELHQEGVPSVFTPGDHDGDWDKRSGDHLSLTEFADPASKKARHVRVAPSHKFRLPNGALGYLSHGHREDPTNDPHNRHWQGLGLLAYQWATQEDHRSEEERRRHRWFSDFHVTRWAKRKVIERWNTEFAEGFAQKMADTAVAEMSTAEAESVPYAVTFYGHSHIPSMKWFESVHAGTGRTLRVLVVNVGDSQNLHHSNAVGIRTDSSIELLEWRQEARSRVSEPIDNRTWRNAFILFGRRIHFFLRGLAGLVPDPRWWASEQLLPKSA